MPVRCNNLTCFSSARTHSRAHTPTQRTAGGNRHPADRHTVEVVLLPGIIRALFATSRTAAHNHRNELHSYPSFGPCFVALAARTSLPRARLPSPPITTPAPSRHPKLHRAQKQINSRTTRAIAMTIARGETLRKKQSTSASSYFVAFTRS